MIRKIVALYGVGARAAELTEEERLELRGKLYLVQKWYFVVQLLAMLFIVGRFSFWGKETLVAASIFAGTNVLLTLMLLWDTRMIDQEAKRNGQE